MAAHNGVRFDYAMLLFETLRHGMSWMPLQNWLFVDTVSLVQAVGLSNLGGCAKLQCLVRGYCVGLQAHRALDDAIVLRDVVNNIAHRLGVSTNCLLSVFSHELDLGASIAHLSSIV